MRQGDRINNMCSEKGFISEQGDEISVAKAEGIGKTIWINRHAATLTFDEIEALRSALNRQ